ncbi:hypothetical protein TNCV_18221 [Trichonephila clavipes]|nr:hypothetical protein TNCV_18221 [Trichonephila clavipes]
MAEFSGSSFVLLDIGHVDDDEMIPPGREWLWSWTRRQFVMSSSPNATEDSSCRGADTRLNLSRLKVLPLIGCGSSDRVPA